MADYKPNSHKYKNEQNEKTKQVSKVVKGSVKTKKKSGLRKIADAFTPEDTSSALLNIVYDTIIPVVKRAILNIVNDSADTLLNGKSGSSRHGSYGNSGGISYRRYYEEPRNTTRSTRAISAQLGCDFDDIIYASRGDAEKVLRKMDEMFETYGFVSLADMYEAAGITPPYTYNRYGWKSLRTATVIKVADGYMIRLPKAALLD